MLIPFFLLDMQPLSFNSNSYASWTVTVPTERIMKINFEIKTEQSTSTLVYAIGFADYSILEVLKIWNLLFFL